MTKPQPSRVIVFGRFLGIGSLRSFRVPSSGKNEQVPNRDAQTEGEPGKGEKLCAPTAVQPRADDTGHYHLQSHGRYLADPFKGYNQRRAFVLLGHRGRIARKACRPAFQLAGRPVDRSFGHNQGFVAAQSFKAATNLVARQSGVNKRRVTFCENLSVSVQPVQREGSCDSAG